ncbi:hypothetical protein ACTFIV_007318 [Dictyostelium citrinum]
MYFYCIKENKEYPENDRLFFKIWRNKSIKNEILFQLKITNSHTSKRFFTFNQLLDGTFSSNPFKDYFKSLLIKNSIKETDIDEQTLKISLKQIPPSVDTLQIIFLDEKLQSIFKTSLLPESITCLSLRINQDKPILNDKTFDIINNNNLKSLHLESLFSFPIIITNNINNNNDNNNDNNDNNDNNNNNNSNSNNNNSNNNNNNNNNNKVSPESILKGSMFSGLTSLNLSIRFNIEILPNVLPNTLKTLILSQDFNRTLYVGSLPQSLSYLKFGRNFNQPIGEKGILPTQLKYLYFGDLFDQSINDLHISTLKVLEFAYYNSLSKKLKLSPSLKNLQSLKLGSRYEFKNIFSSSNNSNSSIDNYISIKKLRVGKKLNIKSLKMFTNLSNLDISSVNKIEMGTLLSSQLLPNTIKKLKINLENNHLKHIKLSKSIERLVLVVDCSPKDTLSFGSLIPNHIKSLDFIIARHISFQPLVLFKNLKNLKSLSFSLYDHSLSKIVNTHNLPSNLLRLVELNEVHNEEEETVFPQSVEILNFDSLSTQIKALVSFPSNLKSLRIFDFNQHSIPKLPDSITLLELPLILSQEIDSTWLPSSLETLILNGNPKIKDLPKTLKALYIDSSNFSILNDHQLFSQLLPIIKVCNIRNLKLFKKLSKL